MPSVAIEGRKMPAPAGKSTLQIEEILITPAQAEEWLKLNTVNRRLSKTTVAAYVRDMQAGNWWLSGDPIRFDEEGRLTDGQHRLTACKQSGVSFRSVVIHNLPSGVIRVLDHGRGRTVADNLYIEGYKATLTLAAAARWLHIFKYGTFVLGKGRVTALEVLGTVDKHQKLQESVLKAHGCAGITPSLLAAVHYVAAHLLDEPELADEFANVFVNGVQYYEDDAAHAWRERLIRMKESRSRIVQDFLQRGTIHSWNNFRERVPVKNARVPDVIAFLGLEYNLL